MIFMLCQGDPSSILEGTCLQDSPKAVILQSYAVSEVEVGEVELEVEPLPLLLQAEAGHGQAELGHLVP